jgi:stage V sporulation protein B
MKEQSTSKGFAILSVGTLLTKVLSLVYNPVLVWVLGGTRGFGIYSATYQIYVFIYVLTNTGIPSAISKLISEYIAVKNYRSAFKVFKISRALLIVLGTLMAITMFFFAGPITSTMGCTEAKDSVIALCPALIFTAMGSAYRGYFQGRGNMKPTAVSQVLEQIINTVFSLFFAFLFMKNGIAQGVVGATMGTTLGALASALFLIVVYEKNKHEQRSRNTIKTIKHTNKQIMRKIIKYSVPITVSIGVINAGTLVDAINTLRRLETGGFSQAAAQSLYGSYGLFNSLINVPITIISALAVTILPAVSRAVALNDRNLVKRKINFALRVCFLIAIPSAVGLAVLSKQIFMFLYYNKPGYQLLIYGTIILVLMSLSQIQTSILQGLGKIYTATIYSVIGITLKISINYFLIVRPKINIYGAIIGSVVGFLFPIILNTIYIRKELKIKIRMRSHAFKPLICSIFMGAVLWVVYNIFSVLIGLVIHGRINNDISTIIALFVGMVAYFYAMFLTKGITKDELEIIPYRFRKHIPKKLLMVR